MAITDEGDLTAPSERLPTLQPQALCWLGTPLFWDVFLMFRISCVLSSPR